jgi:hypothetical protein
MSQSGQDRAERASSSLTTQKVHVISMLGKTLVTRETATVSRQRDELGLPTWVRLRGTVRLSVPV